MQHVFNRYIYNYKQVLLLTKTIDCFLYWNKEKLDEKHKLKKNQLNYLSYLTET